MAYQPDPETLPLLGHIPAKVAGGNAIPIDHFERKPKALVKLKTGAIYMDSEYQLDTDGWPGGANGDGTHLDGTSWNYAGGDRPINANEVPYFVLPKGGWDHAHGIGLGDFAAVIFKDKLVFAVFADRGETFRIGEGSIHLLRRLGFERIKPDGSVLNTGTPPGVITIVFPGSGGNKVYPNQAALLSEIDVKTKPLFEALRDTPPPAALVA
jgi:hypothetical protein